MSGNQETREVVVKFLSDQASLRQLLTDIDSIKSAMQGLSGGGGAGGSVSLPSTPRGALTTSSPSVQPTIMGGGRTQMIPANTNPAAGQSMTGQPAAQSSALSAGNLSIQAQAVTLTAQNVVLNSISFGGSGGGGGAGFGGQSILQNYKLGTSLGGGGGFGQAVAGNLLNSLLPLAPAFAPIAVLSGASEAARAQWVAEMQFGARMRQVGVATAAGARPDLGLATSISVDRDRMQNAALASLANNPFVNAASFGLSGFATQAMEFARQKEVSMAQESELTISRAEGAKASSLNGRALARIFRGFSQEDGSAENQTKSYGINQVMQSMGGFDSILFNNDFGNFFKKNSGNASQIDSVVIPLVQEFSRINAQQFPQLLQALRSGDFGAMQGLSSQSAFSSALRGDYQGVMGFRRNLLMQDPSGGLLNSALDESQGSLERQKLFRMGGIDIAQLGVNAESFNTGRQAALYGGTSARYLTRGQLTANQLTKESILSQQLELKTRDMATAKMTGDDELVKGLQVEISNLQLQMDQSKLRRTELTRQDAADIYGEGSAYQSMRSASAERGVRFAGTFGSAGQIASAENERISVLDEQIALEKQRLALSKQGAMTLQEQYETQARITGLLSQRETIETEISRREFGGGMQLLATRQSGTMAGLGVAYSVGGSVGSMGLSGAALDNRREQLLRVQGMIATERGRSNPDNQYLASLEAQAEQIKAEAFSSFQNGFRPSYGLRAEGRNLDVYTQVINRTNAGQGSVRAAYEGQLSLAGKELGELQKRYQFDMARAKTPDERSAIRENFENARNSIVLGRALPAQQALENGWQERLISQSYNAPGSFNMIASRFTRREASMFNGVLNRAFGGNEKQSDYFRKQGGFFYNAITNQSSSEGFTNAAMTGNSLNVQGSLRVEVVIKKDDGTIVDVQNQQATTGQQLSMVVTTPPQGFVSG